MKTFRGDNATELYCKLLAFCCNGDGQFLNSRGGRVKDVGPVCFELNAESGALPFLLKRSLHPFFALAEASWVLLGRNDLDPLAYFISDYCKYSDDQKTLNGAYGYRLRHYHGLDQLSQAIATLKNDLVSRRVAMTMWSAADLVGSSSKDIPCNVMVMLKIRDGKLDLTVINRSNDVFLGVPYNIFLFHILHRHIANQLMVPCGMQRHFADSLHLYEKNVDDVKAILNAPFFCVSKGVDDFDEDQYLKVNHQAIVSLNFEQIQEQPIRDFFMAYKLYKENHNCSKAIMILPRNTLGLLGYLWFKARSNFEPSDEAEVFEEMMKRPTIIKTEMFEQVKNKSMDEIVDYIQAAEKEVSPLMFDKMLAIVTPKNSVFFINEETVGKKKITEAILLSLILAQTTSDLIDSRRRKEYIEKFNAVCAALDLAYSDVVRFMNHDKDLLEVIKTIQ